ncbi:MAG: ATP synthase F1 subunit delta [Deltaproteobacteria bacterium]|nr:ATP synthase F1 subunit delta [Deltaproteobacteria bacterium]
MSNGVISNRYALAMMNLAAKEKNGEKSIEEFGQGLDVIAEVFSKSETTRKFIGDPKVSRSQKETLIGEFVTSAKIPDLVSTAMKFLASKGRLVLLDEIRHQYHMLADDKLGRAKAEVTVASPIPPKQEEEIRKEYERLSGKKLTLNIRVDPQILGGAITRIGSTVRVSSLQNHLLQIKASIIKGKVEEK